jgi:erythromycin esterase-like protein
MATRNEEPLLGAVIRTARPVGRSAHELDPLLALGADARLVLLGEATHGTHEFYHWRAELTRRLIVENGFHAVAAEADWPDAYRVNRYVRALGSDADAEEALRDFKRFPSWMWRNSDVLDFVGWLRAHNDRLGSSNQKVGFYGLDLYSLRGSISAVLQYLESVDRAAAHRARSRYGCFDHFGADPEDYAHATFLGMAEGCEREVVAQLVELQHRRAEILARDGVAREDEQFQAEQNARVVKNAEEYYRSMFAGRISTWNLRDTHMTDTLSALLSHLDRRVGAGRSKIVVWAHNSHVGDARSTELGSARELNVGQLVRERYGAKARLIGQTTYEGTVTAASEWGAPAERKQVRRGLPGSYEELFHRAGLGDFLLLSDDLRALSTGAERPLLERAIGVVYRPDTERVSHYFRADLMAQFDAVLHIDGTRAVEPLERKSEWARAEEAETYPTGL